MRRYSPKGDVQKKPYYTDRYYVAPQVPKSDVQDDEIFSADLEIIKSKFSVKDAYLQLDQMVVYIDIKDNFGVLELLKNKCDYAQLSELSAIDWLEKRGGFEVFYQLLSLSKRKRVRIKAFIDEKQPVKSVEKLFRSADWSEREMYDMFGIKLSNHPFPKRILMPDDWEGFPLRKSYPLQGDEAASWYEVDKIFGKEARDTIGPEIRDSAKVDRYDTQRFSRLGFEVPKGADISGGEKRKKVQYQEDGGVFLIDRFDEEKTVIIRDRDR